MEVVVDDDIFSNASSVSLIALFQLGLEGRHYITIDPLTGTQFSKWLAGLSRDLKDEVELAYDNGIKESSKGIRRITVRVGSTTRYSDDPPVMSLDDALTFLRRPLKILVENQRNDGAFLLAAASKDQRRTLGDALKHKWIEFDNGGGLGEIHQRLQGNDYRNIATQLLLWVMFDSDARWDYQPSKPSDALKVFCEQPPPDGLGLQANQVHQLKRRMMENYIPKQAVLAWAETQSGSDKVRTARAYNKMSAPQRHHYHLRGGFHKDQKDGRSIPPGFAPHHQDKYLQRGLGNVGEVLKPEFRKQSFKLEESWFLQDDPSWEIQNLIRTIVERL